MRGWYTANPRFRVHGESGLGVVCTSILLSASLPPDSSVCSSALMATRVLPSSFGLSFGLLIAAAVCVRRHLPGRYHPYNAWRASEINRPRRIVLRLQALLFKRPSNAWVPPIAFAFLPLSVLWAAYFVNSSSPCATESCKHFFRQL